MFVGRERELKASAQFKGICTDWLWSQFAAGTLDFEIADVGRWRGNDPAERSQTEIDVVALNMGPRCS